jgi:outer membrane protein insertion porin family
MLSQTTQSASAVEIQACDDFMRPGRPTLHRKAPRENSSPTSAPVEEKALVKCRLLEDGTIQQTVSLRFVGLQAFPNLDALKLIREAGVGLHPERMPDAETAERAADVLKKVLGTKGYVYAVVNAVRDEQFNSVTFQVTEGERLPLADIRFEGTKVFSADELKAVTRGCLSSFERSKDVYDQELLEYCQRNIANFIRSQGYLQAKVAEPRSEVFGNGIVATFKVEEGSLYRLGKITIEGADHLSAADIRKMLPLNQGEVADAEKISKWLFEDLKKSYGDLGYIEYTAEPVPEFRKGSEVDGVVDFKVFIEEGDRFILRSIELEGDQLPTSTFMNASPLQPGDIYNASAFTAFVNQLNQTGLFEPIDKDKDSEFRVDSEERLISIHLKLRKRAQP